MYTIATAAILERFVKDYTMNFLGSPPLEGSNKE